MVEGEPESGAARYSGCLLYTSATCDVSVYEVKEANIEPLDPSRPSSTSQAGIMDEKSQDIIESTVDNILSEIAEGREIASDVLDETTRTAVLQAMNEGKAIQLTANAEVLGEEEIDAADLRIIQAVSYTHLDVYKRQLCE